MTMQEIVANNIRLIRKLHNHSLQLVSIRTGISTSRLSKMENHKLHINLHILQQIADFYHIDIILLLIPVSESNYERWVDLIRSRTKVGLTLEDIKFLLSHR
jgi:transcriptional regulator with XRE-family HTH domain